MAAYTFCGCWFQVAQHISYLRKQYLPLIDLQSSTTILSSTARTTLTQTFYNVEDSAIPEIVYSFPLYDGVSVVSFKCTVGDRVLVGRVKERNQAKAEYKEAVDRGEKAGLLEMLPEAADIFTTKIGNVDANQKIVVEIVYVGELKHDAETDSIRFTVPTNIAPRYGDLSATSKKNIFYTNPALNQGSMKFLVDVAVESSTVIRGIQSPSHPIAVTMGRNAHQDEDVFQNNLASTTLSTPGRPELEKDFVVMVNVKGQDTPRAMLETHPTLTGHRALMTTLVPKFSLPNASPEIVFVVDRSGSMQGKMALVIQALKVFLKSLPTSVKFNICSFGDRHSFLFQRSRAYDQTALEEALDHVNTLSANYGGTQLLQPIEKTVKQRLGGGTPLEIMVLTDGQIFDQDAVFKFINSAATSKVRVFSLGIGSGASTSLVEGMARAGNGFAQFAQDNEKIDKRIIRMLKATLTPFIHDYALEIKYGSEEAPEGEDDFEIIESFTDSMKDIVEESAEKPKQSSVISLFTSNFKESQPNDPSAGRYDHLPKVSEPKILQAPHEIPQLYSFNRTTIYLLFGPDSSKKQPRSVILKGKSEHGPLKLEIPVEDIGQGETIHQLAARKAVQDLEEGRGWITAAKTKKGKLLKDEHNADWERIVEREAVRLGTRFQVGGKHCSFVALENNGGGDDDDDDARTLYESIFPAETDSIVERGKRKGFSLSASSSARNAPAGGLFGATRSAVGGFFGAAPPPAPAPARNVLFSRAPNSAAYGGPTMLPQSRRVSSDKTASVPPPQLAFAAPSFGSASPSYGGGSPAYSLNAPGAASASMKENEESDEDMGYGLFDDGESVPPPPPAPRLARGEQLSSLPAKKIESPKAKTSASVSTTPEDIMHAIIALQEFDGSWKKVNDLLKLVGISEVKFRAEPGIAAQNEIVWATALALAWLETKVADEADVWDMVADKARSWIVSQDGFDDAEMVVEKATGAFFS